MEELKQKVVDDRISRCITQSSKSVRAYSDPIPGDLLIDIFLRVPTKSIARFRCVSKFWASILHRPDFKELFLTKSLTRPKILLSFEGNGELFVFSAPQLQNQDENSSVVATRYKSFPKYFPTQIRSELCGSVFLHGCRGNADPVICNLVTGESITLPSLEGNSSNRISYFVFDPINKQFKVLCITRSPEIRRLSTHRVLTLDDGKRLWRTIQGPIVPHFPYDGEKCINGVLYYKAYREDHSIMIFYFDVRSEKIRAINRDKEMSGDLNWNLFNYKGKLGAFPFSIWSRPKKLVLWVLEDVGKHKWSKTICEMPPFWYETVDLNYKIVGMTGTGELVFMPCCLSNPFYVFYYNVERKNLTRVDIKGLEKFSHQEFTVNTFLDFVENMKLL